MNIYVNRQLPEEALAVLRKVGEVECWPHGAAPSRETLLARVRNVDGLLCLGRDRIDAELLDHAPWLKVVSQLGVGYDNIDVAACTARGVAVGNTPIVTETTADLAFALLLATARRVIEAERICRSGSWETMDLMFLTGRDVHAATIGIVGMGRIGFAMARRAHGFEMNILYTDSRRNPDAERLFGARRTDLDTLLGESDFVSLHTPLLPETRHLIGARELALMRTTAILVNASRGPVVDQAALAEALRARRIAGAGLDVFEVEPIPPDDPILSVDNVTLLPHIGSASAETRLRMAILAAENIAAGIEGRPLPCPVSA